MPPDNKPGLGLLLRRNWRAVVVVALSLLMLLSDTPWLGWSEFWARHTIVTGAVMGAATIALGVLVVDRYLLTREREQWDHVARIAFQDLAREVMLIVRLMAELSGEADYRKRSARPIADEDVDEVHAILDQTFGPTDVRAHLPRPDRLEALFSNGQWGNLAYIAMQRRIEHGRMTVARWAPVMVTNEPLAAVLTGVARVVQDVESIQAPLVERYVDGRAVSAEAIDAWVRTWDAFEERCRSQHSSLVPQAYMYRVKRGLAT